ncbi:MAG: winged helix-turn-helix transcriptional regulator [Deltaproteobacteria bacterium]|nr:winged helix-turn-helix transcriptional regulator [Deltaproteobacteria bacterium]
MRKAHNAARPDPDANDIERIRVALVELRRLFQRKNLTALWAAAAGGDPHLDYADLRLLDAVVVASERKPGSSARRGANGAARMAGPGATVGDIARLVGVDPSRASRHVARAVSRGLLVRRVSQHDARAVVLEITPKGARLQAKGSDLTRARIARAVADWSTADRAVFERLFARFVGAMVR